MSENQQNPLWELLKSIKLTIFLLILLAVAALLGTLIPQQEEALHFVERLNPAVSVFLIKLGFFDLYHSFWFRLIIGFLALNLLICSLDRFPKSLKLMRTQPKADRPQVFENLPEHMSFHVRQPKAEVLATVLSNLRTRYKGIITTEKKAETLLHAEKGRYSYLGVYVVHFSVLLVLLGAITGSIFGFEGFLNLEEGTTARTISLTKTQIPLQLGFGIRCDRFDISYYPDGTPKEYLSELSFLVNDQVVEKKSLRVNHPATVAGITFYQASYGTLIGENARLQISRKDQPQKKLSLEAPPNQTLSLPDGGTFSVIDMNDDFMRLGPAVQIVMKLTGNPERKFWVFQDLEKLDRIQKKYPGMLDPLLDPHASEPYSFILEKHYYTGLQVSRDPGVPLVWAGFLGLVLGLLFTFFTSHRQIRVRIAEQDDQTAVYLVVKSNKNPFAAEQEAQQILQRIQSELSETGSAD